MKKFFKVAGWIFAIAVVLLAWPSSQIYSEIRKAASEDPLVWEENIAALEQETSGLYPPGEAVVFVGSSSIRLWNSLQEDMAPIPVIQHGFGGAKLGDIVHYAERLVTAYDPKAVVIFAGTNDIHPGNTKSPETLLASYQRLVDIIRQGNAQLPVYYIAITPSLMRWEVWPIAQETNRLIEEWSAEQSRLFVIDTGEALMNAAGKPDDANYIFDGLHLSERGYAVWTSIIKPVLLAEVELNSTH